MTQDDVAAMEEDTESPAPPQKKPKNKAKSGKAASKQKPGTFSFHPEDEAIHKV